MKRFYLLLTAFVFGSLTILDAQDSTQKWHLSAGLNMVAVPTYHIVGTDTGFSNSFGLAPSVSLSHNSGFAISYSPKFVMGGNTPGVYMHAVSVGISRYDKALFDYAAVYSHYFFTNNSSVPYSPLSNEIYADLTYKRAWLKPTVAMGVGFGNNTAVTPSASVYDIGFSAGVLHSFDWESGNVGFSVIPSVLLNAGTTEYFSFLNITRYIGHSNKFVNYVKKGAGSGNGRRGGSGSGGTTTTSNTSESFSLTNLQLNMESSIDIDKLAIRPTVSLFIPVSSAAGAGVIPFWQLALQYRF